MRIKHNFLLQRVQNNPFRVHLVGQQFRINRVRVIDSDERMYRRRDIQTKLINKTHFCVPERLHNNERATAPFLFPSSPIRRLINRNRPDIIIYCRGPTDGRTDDSAGLRFDFEFGQRAMHQRGW